MIGEQGHETDRKHDAGKEQEHDVEVAHIRRVVPNRRPELNEILERRERHKEAVRKRVTEEQDKEFVIRETDAVVHPGTMMIHLQHTPAANRTVVSSVRFNGLTSITVAHFSCQSSTLHRQRFAELEQQRSPVALGCILLQLFDQRSRQVKLLW